MSDNANLLRLGANIFQMDPRNKQLLINSADEIEAQAKRIAELEDALTAPEDKP